jgi:polysaccharide transporter, PST family
MLNNFQLKNISTFLTQKFSNSDDLSNIIKNTLWLLGDKIFRLGGGLLVGILVAKYLGPEQFGLFNFAFSFVWLFSYVVTLGLDEILVRDLIKYPEQKNALLGTAIFLKSVGGVVAFIAIVLIIFSIRPEQYDVCLLTITIAVPMILKNIGVFRLWFESQLQSKYNVWAENMAFVSVSLVRLYLIYTHAPLIYFAVALSGEVVISSLAFLYYYKSIGSSITEWKVSKQIAQQLLKESWPLILSGMAIMIYVKSDQFILGLMAGNHETGIYSVAARISEVWFFIPTAIVPSFFPSIMEAKRISKEIYYDKLQKLFNLMSLISITIALTMTFLSKWIVVFLFGNSYAEAGAVLAIHVWSGIFVFLGVSSAKYYIAENLQKNYFYQTLIGAISNVLLNIILIPKFGALGSAIATVIAYGLSLFSCSLFVTTRPLAKMMINSLIFSKKVNI